MTGGSERGGGGLHAKSINNVLPFSLSLLFPWTCSAYESHGDEDLFLSPGMSTFRHVVVVVVDVNLHPPPLVSSSLPLSVDTKNPRSRIRTGESSLKMKPCRELRSYSIYPYPALCTRRAFDISPRYGETRRGDFIARRRIASGIRGYIRRVVRPRFVHEHSAHEYLSNRMWSTFELMIAVEGLILGCCVFRQSLDKNVMRD